MYRLFDFRLTLFKFSILLTATCPTTVGFSGAQCFVIQGKVTVFSHQSLDVDWAQDSFLTYANKAMASGGLSGNYGNITVSQVQMMAEESSQGNDSSTNSTTSTSQQNSKVATARPIFISLAVLAALLLLAIAVMSVRHERKTHHSSDGAKTENGLRRSIDNPALVHDDLIVTNHSSLDLGDTQTKAIQQGDLLHCQDAAEGNGIEVSMTAEAAAALAVAKKETKDKAGTSSSSTPTTRLDSLLSSLENSRITLGNAWLRREAFTKDNSTLLTSTSKKNNREGLLQGILRYTPEVTKSPSYDFNEAECTTVTEEDERQHSSESPPLTLPSGQKYNRPQVGATPLRYEVTDEAYDYERDRVASQGVVVDGSQATKSKKKKRVSWAKNVVLARFSPPVTSVSPKPTIPAYAEQSKSMYAEEKKDGFSSFEFYPPSNVILDGTKNSAELGRGSESPNNQLQEVTTRREKKTAVLDLPHANFHSEVSERNGIEVEMVDDTSADCIGDSSSSVVPNAELQKAADGQAQEGSTINGNKPTKREKRTITKSPSLLPLLSFWKHRNSPPSLVTDCETPQLFTKEVSTTTTMPGVSRGTSISNIESENNSISSRRHDDGGFTTFVFESNRKKSDCTDTILL